MMFLNGWKDGFKAKTAEKRITRRREELQLYDESVCGKRTFTGGGAVDSGRSSNVKKSRRKSAVEEKSIITVALAGNPNVGKSTLFNSITGMRVHTGNWAGKTVGCESADVEYGATVLRFVDIPGAYSLFSHSDEEKIARDYICFGGADVTVIVCDAGALMQNLNLLLQINEIGGRAIVALNMIDDAERRGVFVDTAVLSRELGIPVVSVVAYNKKTLSSLICEIVMNNNSEKTAFSPEYSSGIESAVKKLSEFLLTIPKISTRVQKNVRFLRWIALRFLDSDPILQNEMFSYLKLSEDERQKVLYATENSICDIVNSSDEIEEIKDSLVCTLVSESERIANSAVRREREEKRSFLLVDKFLTGRFSAYPIMILLLALVFWLTLSIANYPSALLSLLFEFAEEKLELLFSLLSFPNWLSGALLSGLFRTLGRVVAVMLPPMVIFFPLFALLEDSGYLPRIAYNLDRPFAKAGACGKQALTMCMGFGCNAVGIVGCRIIDSRRERLLAILTNSLVPCNGRLPMLITLISALFFFFSYEAGNLVVSLALTFYIILGIVATFVITALLSRILFKGERSFFTIELPRYRKPRFLKVILHSLSDKCGSVLLRAVLVAAPMGLVIWIVANVEADGGSLLRLAADALTPVAKIFGVDGVIFLSFVLGLPANEIVIPIMLMIYSSGGALGAELNNFDVGALLYNAGWTPTTAICTATLALFHSPCSTSLITVYKETKSKKLTFLAFLIPTVTGLLLCFFISLISGIFR